MKTAHEKVEINIFRPEDPNLICLYLPEMLGKYSPWLRGIPMPLDGPRAVMDILMKPEYKRNSIIMSGSSYWAVAHNAIPPYKEPYTHYAVASQFTSGFCLITLNPNIKSWPDLQGKRINMYTQGSIINEVFSIVLKFHGIYDQVDKVHVSYSEGKDGLLNGSIDAMNGSFYKGPDVVSTHKALRDLMLKRPTDIHFISFTEEELEEIARKSVFPVMVMKLKAEEIRRRFQLEHGDFIRIRNIHFWGCDKEMDPEITYEICRVLDESMSEYAIKYHAPAQGLTPEKLAEEAIYPLGGLGNCNVKREFFHPGALKYYDEHGIKLVEPPPAGKVTWLEES